MELNHLNAFEDISFPFLPCPLNKHRKFGPQTVISHFSLDNQSNNFILFCNTCLKENEKTNQQILAYDIEDFVENFLKTLTPGKIDYVEPCAQLAQAYERKQHHVGAFKKQIDKEIQIVTNTFDSILQEITRMLTQKRDTLIKSFAVTNDLFSQSYELFNLKYERLFKSNHKCSKLNEINEQKLYEDLRGISNAIEYQALLKDLKELDDLSQ